ncbi:MAG TPA: ABC-2 family transporter protein [Caulobacteraceae bacterium]|nr:ABC-2 family transporter protein [Caulobacteraceae bacterium]
MSALALYLRYAGASVRGQMQYPASFLLLSFSQLVVTGIEFIGVWALFARFGTIEGWTLGEVAVFYGVVNVAFAVADTFTRGFDIFGSEFVRTGNFDRMLLRPRAAAFQLLGYEVRLSRLGRLAQAIVVFAIGVALTHLRFEVRVVGLIAWAIVGGAMLFSGVMVLTATLAFWTVESLELVNVISYGGVEAAQYPLNIYAAWLRNFLIFVVPIGCVAYFPVVAALGHPDPLGAPPWLEALSPAAGFLFLGVSLLIWGVGVRRYRSTGS